MITQKPLEQMEKPELIDRIQNLESDLEYKQSMIDFYKKQLFGSKSERFIAEHDENQQSLFPNDTEAQSETNARDEEITVTYTRPKNRQPRDLSHLPKVEKIIYATEEEKHCPSCKKDRPFIGFEETVFLNYRPAIFERLIQKQEKYGKCTCEDCNPPVVLAAAPNRILPGTFVTEAVLAWICVSKVIDRMPVYHLEKQLNERFKCPISRQTITRWMIQLAPKLQPLVNLLKEYIWAYDVMWIDATSFQVLNETDKKPESSSYAYCAAGGPPGKRVVIFEYSKNHHDFLKEFLLDWKGYLHCDALNCYDFLKKIADIILILCNAHSRRKYDEILKSGTKKKSPVAKQIMKLYQEIYKLEKQAKQEYLSPEDKKIFRANNIKPIMDQIKKIIDQKLPITSESTRLHGALEYTYNNWTGLNNFLLDGRLEIDNNFCERMIKYFAMARKNFLFADSVDGAEALTLHFSLLITAQQNGVEPLAYYNKVLEEIPNCRPDHIEDYEALLPWNIVLDKSE